MLLNICVHTERHVFQDLTLKEQCLFEKESFCDISLLLLLMHSLIFFEETYNSAVFNSNNQSNHLHKKQNMFYEI